MDNVRSTSAANDLTWLAASDDAVTRVVWTSRAPERIEAAVAVPAAESVRSTSAASDLIWVADSVEVYTRVDGDTRAVARVQCPAGALVKKECAAPVPKAVRALSASAEVSFSCAPTSEETESSD